MVFWDLIKSTFIHAPCGHELTDPILSFNAKIPIFKIGRNDSLAIYEF